MFKPKILFLISTYFFIIVLLFLQFYSYNINASPHTFGHNAIQDEIFDDLINMTCMQSPTFDSCVGSVSGNASINIRSIDYFSDAETLNATIWLLSPIQNNVDLNDTISYGMFIDADSNTKSGWQGVDYQLEVSWNNGTWNKILYQFSSSGSDREIINEVYDKIKFFDYDKNYILLSINLDNIGFPEKYKIMLYTEYFTRNKSNWSMDFSNWINIPPKEFSILTTPDPVTLRVGDEKIIGIQVLSNTGSTPEKIDLEIDKDRINNIYVDLVSENFTTNFQKQYSQISNLKIKIPQNFMVGVYEIPINLKIKEFSTVPELLSKNGYLNTGEIYQELPISITVLEEMTLIEKNSGYQREIGSNLFQEFILS